MKASHLIIIVITSLVFACGGDPKTTASPEDARSGASKGQEEEKAQDEGEPAEETSADRSIQRADLVKMLDAGPAVILSRVQTEPVFLKGKFVGFRIVSFNSEPPRVLDLRAGDVVVTINEKSVERPEDFFTVIEELKTASDLNFAILRDGTKQAFVYPIID